VETIISQNTQNNRMFIIQAKNMKKNKSKAGYAPHIFFEDESLVCIE
jgi:hypothetical protein